MTRERLARFEPWIATALACSLGVVLAARTFPVAFLVPPGGLVLDGDLALHAIAQRYMIADAWRWPLLVVPGLETPSGTHIGIADGIPILAMILKSFRGWLPEGFHGIGLWLGISWALQPVAAVWALRGTGEKRLLPLLAVAVLAVSVPAWWSRIGHAALTSHFTILLGLGFYLRLVHRGGLWVWAAAALTLILTLLIHPYLALVFLAILSAVPVTLVLRRDPSWLRAAMCSAGAATTFAGAVSVFGYAGAGGGSGYGDYALNLLSPFWPASSALFPTLPYVDATGHGGWEGYNYMGAGLLLGLAATLCFRLGVVGRLIRRHAGLALVLLALTLVAVTTRIGLASSILVDLGPPPSFLEQFRSSGRLFWPVTYAAILAVVTILARAPMARLGLACVLIVAALQFADVHVLRRNVAGWARGGAYRAPAEAAAALRPLLRRSESLTLLPSYQCIPDPNAVAATLTLLNDIMSVTAERPIPMTTMFVARRQRPVQCNDAGLAAAPLRAGELRVLLPVVQPGLLAKVPGHADHCRPLQGLMVCAQ
ncbi:hypothetical protein GCM10011320_60360 [Neoroseomonas lacus]|uniref:Glycosyltransferase RgtA/B/C/D-like domain-containing protein n=1 Tax=Neoroseomonas lacus TaxID=287609 RepID=A0A917L671_9PROT|nr:hypothetical protein GCM10011320_60360 [Neoroseomonas lacus]